MMRSALRSLPLQQGLIMSVASSLCFLSLHDQDEPGETFEKQQSAAAVNCVLPSKCFVWNPQSVVHCASNEDLKTKEKMQPTQSSPQKIEPASRVRLALAWMHLRSLPLPRMLTTGDPAFNDSQLRRGLRERRKDEQKMQNLQSETQEARRSGNQERINAVFRKMCETAYGKGVTPQVREDFMVRYGCTGWTPEVLSLLVDISRDRGLVEMGAGHGQWARAITDHYQNLEQQKGTAFDIIVAFDDMTELPLSPKVYHYGTRPAHDYFFQKVQKCESPKSVLSKWSCRGRVLLLVFPPPGNMALETIQTYVDIDQKLNDTIVYVGEGRGGANANKELFDYLESGEWALLHVMDVLPSPGGKGFEKLYVLQRQSTTVRKQLFQKNVNNQKE